MWSKRKMMHFEKPMKKTKNINQLYSYLPFLKVKSCDEATDCFLVPANCDFSLFKLLFLEKGFVRTTQ